MERLTYFTQIAYYKGRMYTPILNAKELPTGDQGEIADKHDRLILRHDFTGGLPTLFIAPKGSFSSGFVIGIFRDSQNQETEEMP